MNDQNLPVSQETFFSRLARSWRILTNNPYQVEQEARMQKELESLRALNNMKYDLDQKEYSLARKQDELDKMSSNLATREAKLNEREVALNQREQQLNSREQKIQVVADLYKEGQDMPEETPDFKVITEKLISGKLQDLQEGIRTLQYLLQQNPEMPSQEMRRVISQTDVLHSKFLATLMVYSETLSENEMATCQIGDRKVTLSALLYSLPDILHFDGDALQKEYANLLDKLYEFGVLKGSSRNWVDYKSYDSKASSLLHKYCGKPFYKDSYSSYNDPLRNFKMLKNPNPNVPTMTNSPTTDEIPKTLEAIGISDIIAGKTNKNEDAR